MQKTRKIFSRLTAAVLAGAMLVSGGAVSMTVSAASAKPVLDTDVTVPSAGMFSSEWRALMPTIYRRL